VAAARGLAKLVHQEITEGAQVGGQLLRANPFQNLKHATGKCTHLQFKQKRKKKIQQKN